MANLKIETSGVGIASKDGSTVAADNITIFDYSMSAAMTFIKKDFYGAPSLKGVNFNLNKINEDTFRAQSGTIMVIDGKIIQAEKMNVEALYQTETMKK